MQHFAPHRLKDLKGSKPILLPVKCISSQLVACSHAEAETHEGSPMPITILDLVHLGQSVLFKCSPSMIVNACQPFSIKLTTCFVASVKDACQCVFI